MERNKAYCTLRETIRQYNLSSTLVVEKGSDKKKTHTFKIVFLSNYSHVQSQI